MSYSLFRHAIQCVILGVLIFASQVWAEEPFDYFQNSWNVIGLKDYIDGTRITPDNELLLAEKNRLRFKFGRDLTPLSREQTKTCLDGWLPIILLSAKDGEMQYDFTFWATPLPTVENWRKAFDWPAEGENFLNWTVIKVTNTGSAEAEAKMEVEQTGDPAAAESYTWTLEPGRSADAVIRVPFSPVEDPAVFAGEDPTLWLNRTVKYWRDLMSKAARVRVPCQKATDALRAAHVCQLIANDHGQLQGGEGFYDEFYIRDGGYQIMELEEAGLWDSVNKAIEYYLHSQRPDGRFETQRGQLDANGQGVWVLWQYYKITNDRDWLEKAYPQMRQAVDWATKARREIPADSPYAGVLPPAPADGEFLWEGNHHTVGYDFWNLRALLCTADAAERLGKSAEAEELLREAKHYRAAIDAVWKRTGLPQFPPSWEGEGTHWGNTETLWPTDIFAPDDPRVTALLNEVRENHGSGFIEGAIRWMGVPGAIHPYMSSYSTMASLIRGEHEKVVDEFYWYLLHSTAAHAFPEGIYYSRRFAWSDTIPHVTGASNYSLMLRHMLLHERGDELHLLLAVPDWWLEEGREILVENAPTHFGKVSFRTIGTAKGVKIKFEPPRREPPQRIVLHLPKSRPLVGTAKGIDVETRSDQKKRWDFPTVVNLYNERAPGLNVEPIPGLINPPSRFDPTEDKWEFVDLTPFANTEPFTAPFGVRNSGKLLFTGLPVGVQPVARVPFRIIDPAKNEGHGFVVLHSPNAPQEIAWPSRIEIPVKQKGKRLYFLGNVHGWCSGDPGTGEWGAVAEYVIQYADGEKEIIPLITGRTIDDWTAPPHLVSEVYCGLVGDPWHLNILGVKLRPVEIDKIVFRDLDTPAAPVLAAITIER
ncbi:MAG: hypothetical protein ABIH23_31800 [bacterium]